MTCLPILSPEQAEVETLAHDPHCVLSPCQLCSVVEVHQSMKDIVLQQLGAVTIAVDYLTDCSLQNYKHSAEVIISLHEIEINCMEYRLFLLQWLALFI
jgi:hypothetical protein